MAAGPLERYQKLGLRNSLSRIYHYPLACKELNFILRFAYSKLPKNLQSLIFQDALAAFRLLPEMQTQTAISAANVLLQGAEAAFPKQKKTLAVTEFKHAVVAHKRRSRSRQEEEGLDHLPQDVLVHLFSFLDLRSLVSTALVCRSWNAASSDNLLWKLQYNMFFANSSDCSKTKLVEGESIRIKNYIRLQEDTFTRGSFDWRAVFKKAYRGNLSKKFIRASRGYCKHCYTIVWLSDISTEPCKRNCKYHQIEPLSTSQIVDYLKDDYLSVISSSDSDSDSDEGSISKLWAYPRCISGVHL